jgi:excisionase family DNA binding protein
MARTTDAAADAVPLFVRLPAATAGKLNQVASDLGTSKKNVITALVAGYAGLAGDTAAASRPRATAGSPRRVVIEMGSDPPAVGHAAFFPYEPPEVLSAAEAAELLQVDVSVVENMAAAGELPGRSIAGDWRFSRAAILRWLDHQGEPAQQSPSRRDV